MWCTVVSCMPRLFLFLSGAEPANIKTPKQLRFRVCEPSWTVWRLTFIRSSILYPPMQALLLRTLQSMTPYQRSRLSDGAARVTLWQGPDFAHESPTSRPHRSRACLHVLEPSGYGRRPPREYEVAAVPCGLLGNHSFDQSVISTFSSTSFVLSCFLFLFARMWQNVGPIPNHNSRLSRRFVHFS